MSTKYFGNFRKRQCFTGRYFISANTGNPGDILACLHLLHLGLRIGASLGGLRNTFPVTKTLTSIKNHLSLMQMTTVWHLLIIDSAEYP